MSRYNTNLEIVIDRKKLFYNAYDQIMNKNPFVLKKTLNIKYNEEEGIDFGGILR